MYQSISTNTCSSALWLQAFGSRTRPGGPPYKLTLLNIILEHFAGYKHHSKALPESLESGAKHSLAAPSSVYVFKSPANIVAYRWRYTLATIFIFSCHPKPSANFTSNTKSFASFNNAGHRFILCGVTILTILTATSSEGQSVKPPISACLSLSSSITDTSIPPFFVCQHSVLGLFDYRTSTVQSHYPAPLPHQRFQFCLRANSSFP